MFFHNKRLQYTVRVAETNPGLANLLLEQFGGPQGELAEAVDEQAQLYRKLNGGGNDSHVTQLLYGAGAPLVNSGAVPWTAAYVDTIGEPTADLRSNIAAEARAKIIYERLINVTDDPGIRDALGFLMTREVSHQKSFEKALYSITPNFPPGKLPAVPEYADLYYAMSDGGGARRKSPWNDGHDLRLVEHPPVPTDGGDGKATIALDGDESTTLEAMRHRLKSDPSSDPTTGADLGSGGPDKPRDFPT
ncbi:manganese catalase family protein [Burkholderia pseudomallei]|uniref:manganese catalase family protein n=1 Tax=Burkholderia pseudomallei TaxID=28450 RepID=UPI001035ECDE|nr:manganese catalase family protein [Burkholderia pseudomallei]QBI47634.1 manganese catalase family protein [Burkholderia pseudomallei]QBP49390.1 manganese catalase family protein [Burkholderia pseudomallei]QBP69309.1 manganese catalase family protein [Burkholderia pseudomallei]QBR24809.1 manganese catalase family protein [Burkholderia pseudomallei]